MAERKPFGGVVIDFTGKVDLKDTVDSIMGGVVSPGEMNKKLWEYIRSNGLQKKV